MHAIQRGLLARMAAISTVMAYGNGGSENLLFFFLYVVSISSPFQPTFNPVKSKSQGV
jgi:hypothetical protein